MPYYSTVTILCNKPIADKINSLLLKRPAFEQPDMVDKDTKKGVTRFVWDWVVWHTYDADELGHGVEEILEKEAEYNDGKYAFLRVGENSDDIEFCQDALESPIESAFPAVSLECDGLQFV